MRIISRDTAQAQGLKRYFTGRPCSRGHVAARRVTNFNCVLCQRIQSKQFGASPAGRAAQARHRKTGKRKISMRRYLKSSKGRATVRRNRTTSPNAREAIRRCRQYPKSRETARRYQQSPLGLATTQRYTMKVSLAKLDA